MNLRILVLGGTGFIGPYVVRHLAHMGHEVTLLNRGQRQPEQVSLPEGVRHILGDRNLLPEYRGAFSALKPDVVLDMRSLSERDAAFVAATLTGVAGRLVAVSSMDVYLAYGRLTGTEPGEPVEVPLTEESPLRTRLYPYREEKPRPDDAPDKWMDDYDKIQVEHIVRSNHEMPGTVLRLPMVHGPGTMRYSDYARRMLDDRPVILLDEAMSEWRTARGYADDVALAIALGVVDDRAAGKVYNVAEEESYTLLEWIEMMGEAADWQGAVAVLPAGGAPEHLKPPFDVAQDLTANSARIRAELGYAEITPREEALRSTMEWLLAHPAPEVDPAEYAAEDAALDALL